MGAVRPSEARPARPGIGCARPEIVPSARRGRVASARRAGVEPTSTDDDAHLVHRAGEVSLRMMANVIPRKTQERVRALMAEGVDEYPWQRVVDTVLADPVPAEDLLGKGLRAQRDWFVRSSVTATARAGRAARIAGKTAVAYVLSRLIFFVFYTATVVVMLVLIKHHWPALDIYRILDGLRAVLPSVFAR